MSVHLNSFKELSMEVVNLSATRVTGLRVLDNDLISMLRLVFVTARGGAVFHSLDPALTWGRGGYFSGNPRPTPIQGPPALVSWTGPRLLPPNFNGDPSGVRVGRGLERDRGRESRKRHPAPGR